MSVRELSPEDWPVWKEIRLRALADSPDAFGRTHSEELRFPDAHWQERVAATSSVQLVAEDDSRPVGIAAVWFDPDEPSVASVYSMWVDASVRRRGVGRALLDAAIGRAVARGVPNVQLTVTEGNTGAYEMYRRAGFVETGRREPLREGSELQTLWMARPSA